MDKFISGLLEHSSSPISWTWFGIYVAVFYFILAASLILRFFDVKITMAPGFGVQVSCFLCFMVVVYPVEGAATLVLTIPLWIWLADMGGHHRFTKVRPRRIRVALASLHFFMALYIFGALIRTAVI